MLELRKLTKMTLKLENLPIISLIINLILQNLIHYPRLFFTFLFKKFCVYLSSSILKKEKLFFFHNI